jgi:hypothetical protein
MEPATAAEHEVMPPGQVVQQARYLAGANVPQRGQGLWVQRNLRAGKDTGERGRGGSPAARA